MKSEEERPLSIAVERGQLVIRIGVNVLASAIASGNAFHQFDDEQDEYIRNFAITDAAAFATEIASQMQMEEEDGSSPLSNLLDEMGQAAIDDGCDGIDHKQRIAFGERSKQESW